MASSPQNQLPGVGAAVVRGKKLIIAPTLVPALDEASSTPGNSRNRLRTEEAFN